MQTFVGFIGNVFKYNTFNFQLNEKISYTKPLIPYARLELRKFDEKFFGLEIQNVVIQYTTTSTTSSPTNDN